MRFMRKQGADWQEIRNCGRNAELVLVSKTKADHYTKRNCFNVKHYLNPQETTKLLNSDYLKNHEVLDESLLYCVKPNGKHVCRAYQVAKEHGVESFNIVLGKPIYK